MILYRISYYSHDFYILNNISWNYVTACYLPSRRRVTNPVDCFATYLSSGMLFRFITLNCFSDSPISRYFWLNWFSFSPIVSEKSHLFYMLYVTEFFRLVKLFFTYAWLYLLVCRSFVTFVYFSKSILNMNYYIRLTSHYNVSILVQTALF